MNTAVVTLPVRAVAAVVSSVALRILIAATGNSAADEAERILAEGDGQP